MAAKKTHDNSGTAEGTESGDIPPTEVHGPSPNAATNLAIADIALRGGSIVARRAIERVVLGRKIGPRQASKIIKGRTVGETVLHSVLARVALRSVPGAIVVGGALVAKTLYDRRKARAAQHEGSAELDEMAKNAAAASPSSSEEGRRGGGDAQHRSRSD